MNTIPHYNLWTLQLINWQKFYDLSDNYTFKDANYFLQCFDAVGWAAGRASGL